MEALILDDSAFLPEENYRSQLSRMIEVILDRAKSEFQKQAP
jgi:hypothetical protein